MFCRGSIQWRREARHECAYSKKCSNYFKSRHLAFMNNPVSTTWRRHAVCKSAVLNSMICRGETLNHVNVWYIQEVCFLWAGKIKGSVHISDCLYLLTKLYTWEVKLKIENAVHRQFTVMHRDIESNWIDDMIILIEPNRKISVGSQP